MQDEIHRFCFNVTISDDDLLEDVESFTVSLQLTELLAPQSGVVIQPNVTEIFIQDNEGMQ